MDELVDMAKNSLKGYRLELMTTDYQHMTLGRSKDRHRDVKECLLLAKR